jgi:hypothetical protein
MSVADKIALSECVLFTRQVNSPTEQADLPSQYRCVYALPEGSIMKEGGRRVAS